MPTTPPAAKLTNRRILLIALVAVATLLVAAVVGGEAYARHVVSRCISTQFEQEMGSKIDVSFGAKPMLITWLDGELSSVTVDSADSSFGPAVGMEVHSEFNDLDVVDNGRGGGTIGSSTAEVKWSNEGIQETLGGLVSGVSSSAGSDVLTLDVLGGIAQLEVKPQVENGAIEVETMSAQVLGIGLPNDLVQSIVDTFTESLQNYPLGLEATDIAVTDSGIEVQLAGGPTKLPPSTGDSNVKC